VFTTRTGAPQRRRYMNDTLALSIARVNRQRAVEGLPPLRHQWFHALCHRYGAFQYVGGARDREVADALRHAPGSKVTQRYIHLGAEMRPAAADRMDALFPLVKQEARWPTKWSRQWSRPPERIAPGAVSCSRRGVEATTGFEPVNRGFADLRVEPLHHVAPCDGRTHRGDQSIVAAPRGFEPRFTDSKSAVLPLDEGAAGGDLERSRSDLPGPGMPPGQENGAEDGTRTRDPHLGKVMLYQLSHFRSMHATTAETMVPRARIELATPRFSVACSTN
jgi:hypothetical protein